MNNSATFDWTVQLERTVTNSLVTTFGLDFLFFEDKRGGDVDTIHNVRQGVFASDREQQRYEQRGEYDSAPYHQSAGYIEKGKADKADRNAGVLKDAYSGEAVAPGEKLDRDHTKSALEIHNDPGRTLAELDGVDLANRESNLNSTSATVNRSKGAKPVQQWLDELDANIERQEFALNKARAKLAAMPQNTPDERHKYRQQEEEIKAGEARVAKLKGVDREKMAQKDAEAREAYEKEVNWAYYTSSKFFGSSAVAAAQSGMKMGARQVLGLVLAEIWFELREQVPVMVAKARSKFQLEALMRDIRETLGAIRERLHARMADFWTEFKSSAIAGVLSSVTTTVVNIFLTSEKMVVKLIREMWSHLVKAIKLIAFNPDQLTAVDLTKAVAEVLSFGIASVLGAVVYTEALAVLQFPLGAELAAFVGALSTGLITLALQYFLFHSEVMQKVWGYLASLRKPTLADQAKAANAELDRYLRELAKVELAMDLDELESFDADLRACNDALSRNVVLAAEIDRRGIDLPYVMGDTQSTIKWLASKAKR